MDRGHQAGIRITKETQFMEVSKVSKMTGKALGKWVYAQFKKGQKNVISEQGTSCGERFSDVPGINLTKVLSPVAKYCTLRMMIALSIKHRWFD